MNERVSCDEVASALDEIVEMSGLRVLHRLHRVIAEGTGLHPTTVLRYHRRELESADARVLECIAGLRAAIERGEQVFAQADGLGDGPDGGVGGRVRVTVHEIQRRFDRIVDLLEGHGQDLLYRYVAEAMQADESQVIRWHAGECCETPGGLMSLLDDVARKLSSGDPVVFRQAPGEHGKVVPRRCIKALIDQIDMLGIVPESVPVATAVERILGMKPKTLRRLMDAGNWPFVEYRIYRSLRSFLDGAMYDPTHSYEVGDRLYHHDFCAGTVVAKSHKDRILVEFGGGVRRYLRENVWVDPRWPRPNY